MAEQTPIPAEAIPGEPPTYGRHKPKVIDADCGHDLCYAPCPGPVDVTVCASDEEDWPCEVVRAYAAGLAAGRTDDIPGWVHEYGVSFDGDTLWLECDFCSTPVHGIDAGDSLETIVTKARDHRRTCVAEMGAVRG